MLNFMINVCQFGMDVCYTILHTALIFGAIGGIAWLIGEIPVPVKRGE